MEENTINSNINENNTNYAIETFNYILKNVFLSIDDNIYGLLDDITFIDEGIISNSIFGKITSNTSGILLICNALILGVIIFYSINYLFSHLFISKVDSISQFIFKLIIFTILMNSSFWICEQIINIINLITQIIKQIGNEIFSKELTFSNFVFNVNTRLYTEDFEMALLSFEGIIKSFMSVGFINLIFSNSLRYIMIQVFVIISPFAFLCLINTKTECFFKIWIKTFLSLLLEQILIVLILLLAFSLEKGVDEKLVKLLYVGIMYALIKTNNYMYILFGGISTSVQNNINTLRKIS